jgi:hypothetical protein
MKRAPAGTSKPGWIWTGILLGTLLIPIIPRAGGSMPDFSRLIPSKVGSWEASGKDAVYDRKTLYDYMDGGAEVTLAFDFRQVFARKYAGPGGKEISLDVYDMGSSAEAYGIFSCDREDPDAGIGQDSTYGFGLLRIRQGRYFMVVMSPDEGKDIDAAVLELGKAALPHLGPPGPNPPLVDILPPGGLKTGRTSYFHSEINLNNRFFVASENILGLGKSTECVFAEYGAGNESKGRLLIVAYPGRNDAEKARRSFLEAYLPEGRATGAARTESGTWTLARTHDRYLAVVFDAPTREQAEALEAAVAYPKRGTP